MLQKAIPTEEGQERAPQPLMMGMFYLPSSSFTQRYIEKTIRFPWKLTELYSDQKAAGKRYLAAVQAYMARKECTISLEMPSAFEQSVTATMDIVQDHAINQREALACLTTLELLSNHAKHALKDSHWWSDLFEAKASNKYTFLDTFPAPQPLQINTYRCGGV